MNVSTITGLIPHSRPWITESDYASVQDVLSSGMIASGAMVQRFESAVSDYAGVKGAVATCSGSSALEVALRSLSVADGSEVILPSYVCKSVLQAVQAVGATPVLCDVGPDWVMTRDSVESHVTTRTSVIMVVHTFGMCADVEGILEFGIPVIEDACQSFGMRFGSRESGSIGTIGVYSFHATKCLTTGEGGMLVSDSAEVLDFAQRMRNGCSSRSSAPISDLQAALGLSQLSRYGEFLETRRGIQRQFDECLGRSSDGGCGFRFRYPLRTTRQFEEIQSEFLDLGITVRRGVDNLLHTDLGLDDSRFSQSCELYRTTVSVPFYPGLSEQEISRLVDALEQVQGI